LLPLHQRVFEAEEGGELAGFVVAVDGIEVIVPDLARALLGLAGSLRPAGNLFCDRA
jgi:hypothetical protein